MINTERTGGGLALRRLVLAALLTSAAGGVWGQTPVNGDFEAGIEGWKAYRGAEAGTILSRTSGAGHGGGHAMQVDTRGANRLEGASCTLTTLPDRAYRVDVWLKGSGTVMLCVLRGGTWVYGSPVDATSTWQKSSLHFVSLDTSSAFSVLTTKADPQKVSFCVDDIALTDESTPAVRPIKVAPFAVQAEDFRAPGAFGQVAEDASASRGACVEGRRYFWLTYGVPYVPRTTLPFYIYLRTRVSLDTQSSIVVMRVVPGQKSETVFRMPGPVSTEWQWLRTGPHSCHIGERFCVSSNAVDPKATVALDALVISTQDGLDDKELEEALSDEL
ncbi:MAG: hypothetical protein HN742_32375 [Lentisphaerae bacterium]|nr:hypothetical protein [Lentisphaerota bacterium]MBT5611122.1 hypothetical protein [Lentisphaerota bacterium]MBT7062254.1 hypothetical protein [Lentisphaerota bacterium]MBT7846611.1 hypothetical protein [Lentisphaerota bacterium]